MFGSGRLRTDSSPRKPAVHAPATARRLEVVAGLGADTAAGADLEGGLQRLVELLLQHLQGGFDLCGHRSALPDGSRRSRRG